MLKLIEPHHNIEETLLQRGLLCCAVALPWFFGLALWREEGKPILTRHRLLPELVGLGLILVYASHLVSLPDNFPTKHLLIGLMLALAAHFSVAAGHYNRTDDAFWAFNKSLFLRFLLTSLYSGVIFVGLALALLSLDHLLELKIDGVNYGRLFVVIALVFHPWFFLAGVPRSADAASAEVPTGLRRFVQFVLVPLVGLYLGILYLYSIKIIIAWQLPNGWVALPVLVLGVIGILATLLIHPLRDHDDHHWAGIFTRWFYRLLLPLAVLLMISIGVRIADHGVTENRYFVAVLAGWLFIVASAYGWTRLARIRWIPLSLGALCLFSSLTPWSASAVASRSQLSRTRGLFQRLQLLQDGHLVPRPQHIPADAYEDLRSKIQYLLEMQGPATFAAWLSDEPQLIAPLNRFGAHGRSTEILDYLGLKSTSRRAGEITFTLEPNGPVSIQRGGQALFHQLYSYGEESQSDRIGSVALTWNSTTSLVLRSPEQTVILSWSKMLDDAIKAHLAGKPVAPALLTRTVRLGETMIQISVASAFIQDTQPGQYKINNLQVLLIVYAP